MLFPGVPGIVQFVNSAANNPVSRHCTIERYRRYLPLRCAALPQFWPELYRDCDEKLQTQQHSPMTLLVEKGATNTNANTKITAMRMLGLTTPISHGRQQSETLCSCPRCTTLPSISVLVQCVVQANIAVARSRMKILGYFSHNFLRCKHI